MKKFSVFTVLILWVSTVFSQTWQLVWQDEFNYTGLPDATKWGYDVGNGGWGNNELQNYTADRSENARVENGNLILEARRDWHEGIEYSSARLVSRQKGDWKYGRIEVKAKIPVGKGLWPAIWMLPTDWVYGGWPASGEIDLMENFALNGYTPNEIEGNVHTQSYNHSIGTNKGAKITGLSHIENNYHVYAISWYEDKIDFEVDGKIYFTFANEGNWQAWPYDQRFHLILNIAVGGALGTTPDASIFPKQMTVDYVRVYQQSNGPSPSTGLVTVYADCDQKGFSSGFGVGDYSRQDLIDKGIGDDKISSLKVAEGYKAILYYDDNFGGISTEITTDIHCLNGTWNDKVTSLKIRPNGLQNMAGTYYLRNRESSLYMDVAGGEAATAEGDNLHQWPLTNTKNQQFKFEHLDDGAYKIIALHSGKVLDIDAIKTTNGANLQQWTYLGTNNQKFIVVPTDNANFKLIAMHSGKVIEVAGAKHEQQVNIQQYDNNNQWCGQWRFEPINTSIGTGTGLLGQYFKGQNFDNFVHQQTDPNLNFDWGSSSPIAGLNKDNFSVRWTGEVEAKYSGIHTFYINSDNGRKVWFDEELVVDEWKDNWGADYTFQKTLVAGEKYSIRIDYFEKNGGANILLSWSNPIMAKEAIPQLQLYPNLPPETAITTTQDTAWEGDVVILEWTTEDKDGSITSAEVYFDNQRTNWVDGFAWEATAGEHTLEVRTTDNSGAITIHRKTLIINTTMTTSTYETVVNLETFQAYPNPASTYSFVGFYLNQGSDITLTLIAPNGKPVQTVRQGYFPEGNHDFKVDLTGLTPGLYLVRLSTNNNTYSTILLITQ